MDAAMRLIRKTTYVPRDFKKASATASLSIRVRPSVALTWPQKLLFGVKPPSKKPLLAGAHSNRSSRGLTPTGAVANIL